MADPIGATLKVDISDIKTKLKEANKIIRENETQWRVSAASMDDWTKSEEGLNSRLKSLSKTIEIQSDNVKYLASEKEKAIKQYGAESREVDELNSKLNTQLKALERSRREYKQVTSSLDKLQKENQDANEEIDDTTKESKKASKALDKLEDSAKDAGDGFTIAKGAIASFIGSGLSALVGSIGNAVSSLFNLTESTAEYRREMARVTTVADQVGVSGDRIIDKWIDMNAVIQDESSVTEGLNNLMTAGFTAEKELDAITKALEGASIQWAETLKFEGLSDSLQEWIGSDGASLTGQFAELLERLGYNLEDVEKATEGMTDAQRRNWAIQTLNANGLSEMSDAYREANKDMIAYNKANSDLLHAQSMLGEQMQPFVTTIKQGTADILYSFIDMTNGVEGAGDQLIYNVGYLAGQIYGSIRSLISQMLPTISSFFPQVVTLITTNLPLMIEQGIAIATNIVNGIAQNIPQATQEISGMISGILLAIAGSAPECLASAVNLFGQILLGLSQMLVDLTAQLPTVITTVTDGLLNGEQSVLDTAIDVMMGIVEAIPTIVNELLANLPQIIDTILKALSDALPKVFDGAITLLTEIVNAIPSIVSSLANNLPQIIDSIVKGLSNGLPKVASGASKLLTEIIKAIPSIASSLIENMPQIIKAIVKGLAQGTAEIFKAGVDLIKGLVNGILSFDVVGALKGVGNSILNGFKSFFGIQSPSRIMRDEVGKYIAQGMAVGIKDGEYYVADSVEELSKAGISAFSNAFSPEPIAKDISNTLAQASRMINIGTDLSSTLKSGDTQAIADDIFGIAGQVGGPWGMLADAIWSFVSDNLLGKSPEEIKETAQGMVDNLLDTIMMVLTNLPDIVSGAIEFMKTFSLGLIEGIPQIVEQIPKIIQELITVLIAEGIPAMIQVGVELIKMLMKSMFDWNTIWEGVKAVFNGIVDGFKSLFGIKSPSKVMADEVGKNIALGIEEGVTDNLKGVNDAIRTGVDTSLQMDGIQRKYVTVNQTNHYAQAHSRYELYKSKHDTANAVKLALQGV